MMFGSWASVRVKKRKELDVGNGIYLYLIFEYVESRTLLSHPESYLAMASAHSIPSFVAIYTRLAFAHNQGIVIAPALYNQYLSIVNGIACDSKNTLIVCTYCGSGSCSGILELDLGGPASPEGEVLTSD